MMAEGAQAAARKCVVCKTEAPRSGAAPTCARAGCIAAWTAYLGGKSERPRANGRAVLGEYVEDPVDAPSDKNDADDVRLPTRATPELRRAGGGQRR
jgi:hypothetical protein